MTARLLVAAILLGSAAFADGSLPAPAPGNVTLPLEEYDKLVELAAKPPMKVEETPLAHVIKTTQIDLKVDGELATGTLTLEGEVYAKGNHKVRLFGEGIVLDAHQQNGELPLVREDGAYFAVLNGPVEFTATLQVVIPLRIEPGRAAFAVPTPATGTVRLKLSVPGEQTEVRMGNGLITSRTSSGGRTLAEATLVPASNVTLWWGTRLGVQNLAAPKAARFLAEIKSLISVSEDQVAVGALAGIMVMQGEPAQFEVQIPEGYEVTGVTGTTLSGWSPAEGRPNVIVLKMDSPALRSHQFLVSLAKAGVGTKVEVPFIDVLGAQRETGEVLVEGEGAIELTAAERGGLRRMDLKEADPTLRSLARSPLHAAFRYQKRPSETPALALEWVRFPDSQVLSAVAQRAVVTTMVTSEGRTLTEVKLTVKNQAQPFLKIGLPAGASILSAEVAGEKVKPVQGADGSRVPLLRAGFRPSGSYSISYVFLHAGAPFEKKGGAELSLPKMDVPIGMLEWEVFLPQQYKVADFGGDALAAQLFPAAAEDTEEEAASPAAAPAPLAPVPFAPVGEPGSGDVGGVVRDPSGAPIPFAGVSVYHVPTGSTFTASADRNGRYLISGVPGGQIRITFSSTGFNPQVRTTVHNPGHPTRVDGPLQLGSVSETVEVTASPRELRKEAQQAQRMERANLSANAQMANVGPSANVTEFQRRVAGVLPIAVNVPRTGNSYRFMRPLVVDEETRLTFAYRSK